MRKRLHQIAVTIALTAAAIIGYTATDDPVVQPADTTWGAPAPTLMDTTWG